MAFFKKCLLQLLAFLFFYCIFQFLKFLAVLGLHCCTRGFSSCSEQGLLLVVVRGLLIAVASLVAEQGSRPSGFSSCGSRRFHMPQSNLARAPQLLSLRSRALEPQLTFLFNGKESVNKVSIPTEQTRA